MTELTTIDEKETSGSENPNTIAIDLGGGKVIHLSQEQALSLQQQINNQVPPTFEYELSKLETHAISTAQEVLQEVVADILASTDIDRSRLPEKKEFSLTGQHDTVLQMTLHDFVKNMSRMFYELWQGINDYGFLGKDEPGWKPPAVLVHHDSTNTQHYDGKQTISGCDALEFRNQGTLDINHLSLLASDDATFKERGGTLRDGGYGQGLKVALLVFASTFEDRMSSLIQYRNNKKGQGMDDKSRLAVDRKIRELEEQESRVPSYVTIQAREADKYDDAGNFVEAGRYYRAYVYRRPVQHSHGRTWSIDYSICWLDEEKIADEDKDMVAIAIHHPDHQLTQAFDEAHKNILGLNAHYDGSKSLIPDEEKIDGGKTRRFILKNSEVFSDESTGEVIVEVLEGVTAEPGIFFMGTRLTPSSRFSLLGRYSYNIIPSTETLNHIKRSQDSINIDGQVSKLISKVVGQFTSQEEWEHIFTNLAALHTTASYSDYPELNPKFPQDAQIGETLRAAFNVVFPAADKYYYNSKRMTRDELWLWQQLKGTECIPAPFNATYDIALLKIAGLEDIEEELKSLLRAKFGFTESPYRVQKMDGSMMAELATLVPTDSIGPALLHFFTTLNPHAEEGGRVVTYGLRKGAIEIYTEHTVYANGLSDWFNEKWITREFDGKEQSQRAAQESLTLALLQFFEKKGFKASFRSYTDGSRVIAYRQLNSDHSLVGLSGCSNDRLPMNSAALRIEGSTDELLKIISYLDKQVAADQNLSILLSNRSLHEDMDTETMSKQAKIEAQEQRLRQLEALEAKKKKRLQEMNKEGAEVFKFLNDLQPSAVHGMEGMGDGGADFDTNMYNFVGGSTGGFRIRTEEHNRSLNSVEVSADGNEKQHGRYFTPDYTSQTAPDDDLFPLQAADQVSRVGDEYVFTSSAKRSFENGQGGQGPVEGNSLGRNIWYAFNRQQDDTSTIFKKDEWTYPNGIQVRLNHYDQLLRFNKHMHPVGGNEAVLPIDAIKYEITYIQLPIGEGAEIVRRPQLLLDMINNQYLIRFSPNEGDEADSTSTKYRGTFLPKGTRIYYKERSKVKQDQSLFSYEHQNFMSHRLYYEVEAPDYLVALQEKLLRKNHLDADVVEFLDKIKQTPNLTIAQRVRAAYLFYEKRRNYDPHRPIKSLEDLINGGHGVCKEAAGALLSLLREENIACRLRLAYPDNTRSGSLIAPLHVVVEYLDDNGYWASIDPPNGALSPKFALKVLKEMTAERAPVIRDAASLARGTDEVGQYLPLDMEMYLDSLPSVNGLHLPSNFYQLSEELLHGGYASYRKWLEMVLALGDQDEQELAQAVESQVKLATQKVVDEALSTLTKLKTSGRFMSSELQRSAEALTLKHYASRVKELLLGR